MTSGMRIVLTAFIMGNAISCGATDITALPASDNANPNATHTSGHDSPCWFTRQSGVESHYMILRLCRQAEAARSMNLPHQESSALPTPSRQPG